MMIEENDMDLTCWYCHRPILRSERAHRSPHGTLAVHADCLRHDALAEGIRPSPDEVVRTV